MPAGFMVFHMYLFMQDLPLCGKLIFFPDLFQVYQGKTPVTITNVR
jgi:hypothetical protein